MATKTLADYAAEIDRYGRLAIEPTMNHCIGDLLYESETETVVAEEDEPKYESVAVECLHLLDSTIDQLRSIAWGRSVRGEVVELISAAKAHVRRIMADHGLISNRSHA